MKFRSVKIFECRLDLIPCLFRCFFRARILRGTLATVLIENRWPFRKLNSNFISYLLFLLRLLSLENINAESAVITTYRCSVIHLEVFCIIPEVILQFFLETSLREWIWNSCLVTIGVIHLPSSFEACPILSLEYMITVQYKVVEVVGCSHHSRRNIIVVPSRIVQIYFQAVTRNCSKLEWDLFHTSFVFTSIKLIPRRMYINEPSDQTRFTVCDLDGLVCPHKQKALKPIGVSALKLLIDCH